MSRWTEEQLEAIEKEGTNIIVSAGAGSGKTAVLTERVIRKLKQGISINELLILTFTKAAASEMRERIRSSIKKSPELINELDKIDAAYITTFDSYALSIVKKYHYLYNLSPNISICEQSILDIKKEEILESIFENNYEQGKPNFLKLINDFCTKDDTEIKSMILSIYNKLELKYDKQDYLNKYLDIYFDSSKINKDLTKYQNLVLNQRNIVIKELDNLKHNVENDYYIKLEDSLIALIDSTSYDEIRNITSIKLPNLPKNSLESVKKSKDNISNALKEINRLCQEDLETLENQVLLTKDYAEIIIELITSMDQKLSEYKLENDLYDFNDIAKQSIKTLKDNEWIREEIKKSFNEILVDEYQDTNDIQESFISMIQNNNVYMVGDIKQSIYRFRNANPYIFKNKYDKYKNNDGGIKIDLNKNFRSREEVLSNINLIFDKVMDDRIGGASYSEGHQMVFGNNTYNSDGHTGQNNNFEIYEYEYNKEDNYKKEEIEIFIVANDIKNKVANNYKVFDKDKGIIREIEYQDFVILMDRTKDFNLYKKIFEYMGIPLTLYKDETINDGEEVTIIKNILKLIVKEKNFEYDNEYIYSFMSIARSYLFSYPDDYIFSVIKNRSFKDTTITKSLTNLKEIFESASLSNFIEEIIKEYNFYQKIIEVGDIDQRLIRLENILNISSNLESSGYNIISFLEYLETISSKNQDIKISLNKETENSVKIMTIHKSKGLEYSICYYTGLYSKFNIRDLNERFTFDNNYGFLIPFNDKGIRNTFYKELLKNDYIKEEISEKIRLFYVALTRAKEKLILISEFKENSCDNYYSNKVNEETKLKYNSFQSIVNSVKDDIDKYITKVDLTKINLSKDYNNIKIENYKNNINDLPKIITKELDIKEEKIDLKSFSKKPRELITKEEKKMMETGIQFHKILEYLDFSNPDLSNLTEFYKNKISKFLELVINKNEIINIYKEYEFDYLKDQINYHGVIDLILEYPDKMTIIDYKLKNISDPKYVEQLKGYKIYLESITDKKVDIYLYSILEERLEHLI